MSNETLFFICGGALALSAITVGIVGLKAKNFPGRAFPLVILWFAILVGGSATFAVLHAKDEDKAKAAELEKAGKGFEAESEDQAAEGKSEEQPGGKPQPKPETAAKGPGGTLKLAADPSAIAYDTTNLTSKPGKVTIDFTNPAPLEHDVAIEGEDGKEIVSSELITKSSTSVSAELAPGTYTYFCTVPGHREAGMEGTLTVK
ncbi:MAG TPA: plastocyanin/azurin family copper-binding protein [Solirubrobacterales bacterium]